MLGNDAASGKPVVARLGRFGPMVQIGGSEDEEKPRFAKLRPTQSIETITLEEALDLFKLPINLGQYNGKDVSVSIGRFGPYIKLDDSFISIPRHIDPFTVDMDAAMQLIKEKEQADGRSSTKEN